MQVRQAALAWHDAGYAVLPTKTDGSKAPAVTTWSNYQAEAPTRQQIETWFANGHPGLGLICGAISGGLEMLELEGHAVTEGVLTDLVALLKEAGLHELWQRISTGYAERSPAGGIHFLYRVEGGEVGGNTKLARRPATDAELAERPGDRIRVLIETRGEGGYVVIAPSHGPTHPTGQPWTLIKGTPGAVPTITAGERQELHRVIRCLDHTPAPEPAPTRALQAVRDSDDVKPGDDYEQRTTWADILQPRGWRPIFTRAGRTYWKRPGKTTPGISATTGGAADGRDRLYIFTTASELPSEQPLTKFGAYALLEHGGNYSDAAKALRRDGYGKKTDPPAPAPRLAAIDGTSARVLHEANPGPEKFGPTEAGMARALVANHGHQLRYCAQRGRWLMWNGHRWRWDDAEKHRELILELADRIPNDKEWATFHRRAMSAAGVTGIARLAQHNERVAINADQLDANPWELNTPAGIIDLRRGTIRDADPSALHTRTTNCALDPATDPTRWRQFLADTFGDHPDLIAYLRRLVGYSAVGLVGPHVLPFCHGSGGNGKGVFLEALAGVLGDYATTAPVGFLMAQTHVGHETEIARLAGARMVICSEVNEGDRFDEAKVKMLTGGDSLTARFMRQDHFTFTPTHQLWLMGNHQPAVRSGGRSFWRRLRLIPFEHEVPEEKIVDDLQGIFVREYGPALLAWIVAGAAEYHARGLQEPDSVKTATAEYALDQDTVAKFVQECCHIGGGDHVKVKTSRVREAYESFCHAEGETPVSAKALGMALEKRFGVLRLRTPHARMYGNLALLVDEDASSDASSARDEQGGW